MSSWGYARDMYNSQAKVYVRDGMVGKGTVVPSADGMVRVTEEQFVEVTKKNRFKLFNTFCAVCGKWIHGRPAEYPYYLKKNGKYLWLCDAHTWIRNVKIIESTEGTDEESGVES